MGQPVVLTWMHQQVHLRIVDGVLGGLDVHCHCRGSLHTCNLRHVCVQRHLLAERCVPVGRRQLAVPVELLQVDR